MGSCQKMPKFDFQSQFSMSTIIQVFLNFFPLKNIFCCWHFLITSILNHFITKMMPNFWQLAATPILKIQEFFLGMLIHRKKTLLIFYPPPEYSTTRSHLSCTNKILKKKVSFLRDCMQKNIQIARYCGVRYLTSNTVNP